MSLFIGLALLISNAFGLNNTDHSNSRTVQMVETLAKSFSPEYRRSSQRAQDLIKDPTLFEYQECCFDRAGSSSNLQD